MRGNSKLFRIKKEYIKVVKDVCFDIEKAFREGYVFIKEKNKEDVYMINTTVSKKTFTVSLINVEIVE